MGSGSDYLRSQEKNAKMRQIEDKVRRLKT